MTRHTAEPASLTHTAVSKALTALGVAHRSQATTDKGLFVVNILTSSPRVVIQVDGPAEFTLNTSRPLGEPWGSSRSSAACWGSLPLYCSSM